MTERRTDFTMNLLSALWAWCALLGVTLLTLVAVTVLPKQTWRRSSARIAAQLFLWLSGVRLAVAGLANVPEEACIVVANHCSYLDGIILSAVLPPRFGFVIKREMTRIPIAHFLLRRVGSVFVERFDTRRGASDARRILGLAATRQSLAFFPEGTFRAEPGLRRFHNGAFAAAVRGNVPLVPVAIRGSRECLPPDSWFLRAGKLDVVVKPAIAPDGASDPIAYLLQESRRSILEELTEPDLVAA
jgi:1-acyl-sn-glycerol-3-phosphate acyltransferase